MASVVSDDVLCEGVGDVVVLVGQLVPADGASGGNTPTSYFILDQSCALAKLSAEAALRGCSGLPSRLSDQPLQKVGALDPDIWGNRWRLYESDEATVAVVKSVVRHGRADISGSC